MSAPTNHWKLGLFVVVMVLVGFVFVGYLGARSIPKETVTYASYFDEAVTGLEGGSPVRFRGVTIGNVTRIEVAPDRRHVKVSYELTVSQLAAFGIGRGAGEKTRLPMAPDLRAQLTSSGITGIKYVQLDFFDVSNARVDELPFPVGDHYIPAQPSSMKNIETSVVQTADRLPEVADRLIALLDRMQRVTQQLEEQRLPERTGALLARADHTLETLDGKLAGIDTRALSQEAHTTLATWQGTASRVNTLLDRVGGDHGLLASAQVFTDSLGDTARSAGGASSELEHTLRDVSEAAAAIRDLADALERQPDMLIKGRTRAER
jgi:paraquat-inducible protein B